MIRDYRDDLLAFMDTVNMDNQLLSLIRYEDIQNNLSWKTRYFNDLEYTTKLNALMACVSDSEGLYQAEGRGLFLRLCVSRIPAFSSCLNRFSLHYPTLSLKRMPGSSRLSTASFTVSS